MSGTGFYADTEAITAASRALSDVASAFDGDVLAFAGGAAPADAVRAFGDLSAMAETGQRYLDMTSATVTALQQTGTVIEGDANRLGATSIVYERADQTVASAAPEPAGSPGPRIVAVNFADLQGSRDAVDRLAQQLTTEIEHMTRNTAVLRAHWQSSAAELFQHAESELLHQERGVLQQVLQFRGWLSTSLTDYEAAEQHTTELWPPVSPAPPPPPDVHTTPVPGVEWEEIATDIARALLSVFGLPWPGGRPPELRVLASSWRAMGAASDQMLLDLTAPVSAIVGSSWRGSAAEAFGEHVRAQHDHLAAAPAQLRGVAAGLEQYAAEVEQIVGTIVQICLEIVIMIAVSRLIGLVTGFVSDLLTSGVVAARVAEISALLVRLAESAGTLGQKVLQAVRAIGTIRTVLSGLAGEARVQLSATRLGSAVRSLDAFATRVGGENYGTLLKEGFREWRIDAFATAAQEELTQGHVDPGLVALNATGTGLGRVGQLRLEELSSVVRGWRAAKPLVYAGASRAVLSVSNGAWIDPASGRNAESTWIDLGARALYAAPRGVLNNHPTLGPRRPGVPLAQTSVERSTLKVAEKTGRTWTEDEIKDPHSYEPHPGPVVAVAPG